MIIEQFELGLSLEVRNRKAAKLQNTRISLKNLSETRSISVRKYLRSQRRATHIVKRRGRAPRAQDGVRGKLMIFSLLSLLACRPAYGRHMLSCQPLAGTSEPYGPHKGPAGLA